MHCLFFNKDVESLKKKFNICFLERLQDRATSHCKDRTLFVSQFDEGKIYENELSFKSQENDTEVATLSIKIQYIKDEEQLIHSILDLCENKRKLLSMLLKN
mmetsp:Transcript_4043/g.3823  ORF Transcript_4043/g.3823 Transcript_4043/m.3823 type:complete len:102 (+) Transcript_4043:794-1099(+)